MKKSIFVIALIMLPVLSFSQNKFGVLAGINNASLSNDFLRGVHVDKVFSMHFGGLYQHNFNDKVAFRPKLLLSLQGDRKEGSGGSYPFFGNTIDYKLTYINVPLNFKFFSKPYITAGPQLGFLLSTKKGNADFGEIENEIDYGLNCGIGYDLNRFFIEANIYQGVNSLMKIKNYGDSKIGITNTVLQLSLGYYLK